MEDYAWLYIKACIGDLLISADERIGPDMRSLALDEI